MRAIDCDCGHHMEAANDEELFTKARAHVDQDHPEMQLTDEQIRQIVAERAYDKADILSQPSDPLAGVDIPARAAGVMGGVGGMAPSATRPGEDAPPPRDRQEEVSRERRRSPETGTRRPWWRRIFGGG